LAADQARFGIHLAGGDSVTTPGPTMLSLTCLGLVPAGQALTRRTQGPDDSVWVTGTIGDAALGLLVAQGKLAVEDRDRRHLVERLRRPTPRLDLVPMLRGVAASGLDVSDGLVADLGHICERSGFDAEIDAAALPLSPAARAVLDRHPELLATVLTGGDDYETVFTVPARREGEVRDATRIGRLTGPGPGRVTVRDAAGQPLDLSASGWKHF
jgi:thiamine-monophosphate kinase